MTDLSGAHKGIKQILKNAVAQGCLISRTRSGHWRISRPGVASITVSNTPSDTRALRNVRADARRHLGVTL